MRSRTLPPPGCPHCRHAYRVSRAAVSASARRAGPFSGDSAAAGDPLLVMVCRSSVSSTRPIGPFPQGSIWRIHAIFPRVAASFGCPPFAFAASASARLPSCPPCHHTRSPGRAARAAATPRVRHGRRRRRHAPDDVVSGGHAGVGFSDRQVRGDVERVAGGPHVVRRSGPDLRPRLGRHRGRCPQPGGVRELVRRRQVVQCEERERRVRARVFGEWRRVSQRGIRHGRIGHGDGGRLEERLPPARPLRMGMGSPRRREQQGIHLQRQQHGLRRGLVPGQFRRRHQSRGNEGRQRTWSLRHERERQRVVLERLHGCTFLPRLFQLPERRQRVRK